MVWASLSLSSICKLLILVYEHIFRLKQVEQMCKCVAISPQSKLKTFSTLFLRYLSRNSCSKFGKVLWWSLWIEFVEISSTALLLKTFFWTWIFFKHCKVKWKIFSKKMQVAWKLLDDYIGSGKSKTLKKEKEKREMKKSQITAFLFKFFI